MHGPDPRNPHPMPGFPQVCYLNNVIQDPNIVIGEYTYYDDPQGPERFARNVLYHFDFIGDKLVIGKFCAIARDVKFIMNGANHLQSGLSTYPFGIFAGGWESAMPALSDLPYRGDTVVGNDVWIGYDALIMPGVRIGDGAIIAARAVVTRDVAPYTVVAGNPARQVKERFPPEQARRLQAVAWWDRSPAWITAQLAAITKGDLDALERASAS